MKESPSRAIVTVTTIVIALAAGLAVTVTDTGSGAFMPHAHCYLFNRHLILLHGVSDLMIGCSYVAISGTLVYMVLMTRRELPFHWMMMAFATFIVACGATHFMEVWTLQSEHPPYWLAGWVKLVTATASVVTALLLPPLIPKLRQVLQNARSAEEQREILARAYAELKSHYDKATKTASDENEKSGKTAPAVNLAMLARKVSAHTQQLTSAKETAEAANLAKDQFLAVLSHELRTPLTPALTAATNLESAEHLEPGELREGLAIIRRNIELEARLVDDLLDLTRINKGKLEIKASTINLHDTIQHAVEMCRSEAQRRGSEMSVDLEADHHYVRGDGARLTQVFWNLLLNAVKFTPMNGKIRVRTTNPSPGLVSAEVVDTGIGIEPTMLSRIFEPFQQGEASVVRRYGGLGLGLSVAKGFVTAHGGSINAQSEGKDTGSRFTVELATTEPPPAPRVSKDKAAAPEVKRLRILLTEDHEDSRAALQRLLERWGHEVKSASTVAEAVETLRTFEADLLLSDIGLPDGTGIDLIRKAREFRPVKGIAMSGYGMEADVKLTKDAGYVEHLIKPVSAERLKEALAQAFEE